MQLIQIVIAGKNITAIAKAIKISYKNKISFF